MPATLSATDPNLLLAEKRLRRILRIWAGLFILMGFASFSVLRGEHPFSAAAWIAIALLLAVGGQPAYLAPVAVHAVLSLVPLLPGLSAVLGPEPLSAIVGSSGFETVGLALVRLGLMITAWNQFLFYRMLYGTQSATGLDPDLPDIPEIVPNRTDQIALAAAVLGIVGLALAWSGSFLGPVDLTRHTRDLAIGLGSIAIGLGLGASFAPTRRRSLALAGIALGMLSFLSAIAIGSRFAGPLGA